MKYYIKYDDSRQQIRSSSRLGSQVGKDRLHRHIQSLTRPKLVNRLTRWLRSACGNKWCDLNFRGKTGMALFKRLMRYSKKKVSKTWLVHLDNNTFDSISFVLISLFSICEFWFFLLGFVSPFVCETCWFISITTASIA